MKRFAIYQLLIAPLFLSACQKKYCFVCDTLIHEARGIKTGSCIERSQVCDKTDQEIKGYEKEKTATASPTVGSITYTTTIVATCSRYPGCKMPCSIMAKQPHALLMADLSADYYTHVELLGQSNFESTLHALSEGKTGNCEYNNFLPADIVERAESALDDFLKALADYKANHLINGSLK